MGFDTLVDKAKLEAGLTASADAIRQKTGGTEQILWAEETGFAEAIAAISGGSDLPAGVVRTDVFDLTVSTHGVGGNFSCNYGKKLVLVDGALSVDEVLTANSALGVDYLAGKLRGNYLVKGVDIYYIPTDAVFTSSSATEDYVTTFYLKVNVAGKMEVVAELPDAEGVGF